MARRQAVQLQADLQTDEDFDKFLEQSGLLIIDVYSDWCGPCVGMLGTLRKIKLEQGGENINLAIAKSDTISYVSRFYRKSEPTWLFIVNGNAINIMFGSNCPDFLKLLAEELRLLTKKDRATYNITEMQPKEVLRDNEKNATKRAKIQREQAEKETKRIDYFYFVTNTIHENLHDVGITVFGPHISRDIYRQLIEYGHEKFGIQCKDRRNQVITKEQFDIINTKCENPLSADIFQAIEGKECFICYWKVPDDFQESVAEVLQKYADDITMPHKGDDEELTTPLIVDTRVQITYERADDEECPAEDQLATPKDSKHQIIPTTDLPRKSLLPKDEEEEEGEGGADEDEEHNVGEGPAEELPPAADTGLDLELSVENVLKKSNESLIDDEKQRMSHICQRMINVPAVWVPKDWRTHAALIYLYFHAQTSSFLPPDPEPEPPHIIMAFDTHKKRDLLEFAMRNKKDVPVHGFFTSDDADETKFIANSYLSYIHQPQNPPDKLVFKVNKSTSHTMLSLVTYGPTYVSANTTIGAEEAKIFFPEGYVAAEPNLFEPPKRGRDHKTSIDNTKDVKPPHKNQKRTSSKTELNHKASRAGSKTELQHKTSRAGSISTNHRGSKERGSKDASHDKEAATANDNEAATAADKEAAAAATTAPIEAAAPITEPEGTEHDNAVKVIEQSEGLNEGITVEPAQPTNEKAEQLEAPQPSYEPAEQEVQVIDATTMAPATQDEVADKSTMQAEAAAPA